MNNFLKVIIASFFSICFCYKTYAFDLKSLTDKIQKDIGNKLQVPNGGNSSGNSNPLGGMLKNLNKNKGGGSSLNLGNMSQASSSGTGGGFRSIKIPLVAGPTSSASSSSSPSATMYMMLMMQNDKNKNIFFPSNST